MSLRGGTTKQSMPKQTHKTLWYYFGMNKSPSIYIMASKKNGTLYTGVTSNLIKRIYDHKNNLSEGFTKRYIVIPWFIMNAPVICTQLLHGKNK